MPKTHIALFKGQSDQFEVGTDFPASREEAMYIVGTDDGLDDGDTYFALTGAVLGVRIGGSWQLISFVPA